jgi:hypothetical protein
MVVDKKILSVENDDDYKDYGEFNEFLENHTKRQKLKAAQEIEKAGKDLLIEIEKKKLRKEIQKDKLILYILKQDKKIYSSDVLKSYSYEDVLEIYNELKANKQSKISKIFKFLFNL